MNGQTLRWEQVKAVFGAALEHDDRGRRRFIDQACADDPALKREVLSLVRAHASASDFLSSPVVLSAMSWDGEHTHDMEAVALPIPLVGRAVSHYRLEERIGAGGMGVVYRARDLALGRDAAFKIVPRDFSEALRTSLIAEAEASARLQHPGLATFYEAGEEEDIAFIAMELVRGETLRQRLERGPLPIQQAVAVASCLLEALSHAHAAGVVHGDIKPENVMLTGPMTAKLLDFGLAKHVIAAGESPAAVSRAGRSLGGTIGYMSPEQVRNRSLDARSDVFQVGILLYETLAGQPAFPGATVGERLAAVLSDDPPPLSRPGLVPNLGAAIERALAKDPDQRYPTAGAFLRALREASGGESLDDLPDSVVVLDFVNQGGSPDDEWIGRGIAEAVVADLGGVDGLEVVRREQMLAARAARPADAAPAPADVALILGCRWAVAGSYQRAGDTLSVTMSLVEAATGRAAASERISDSLLQLFAIESRLVQAVTEAVRPSPSVREGRATRPSFQAFESFARAQQLFDRRDRGSIEQAGELFAEAVQREPTYAPALAALAGVYVGRFAYTADPENLSQAIALAERAIVSDPDSAVAHTWLGYALGRRGELLRAREAFRRAREADPRSAYAYYFGVPLAVRLGRPDEALVLAQRAVVLAPRPASALWGLGCLYLTRGQYSEAKWCFTRSIELCRQPGRSEGLPAAEGCLGECLRRMGQLEEARRQCLAGVERAEQTDYVYRDTNRVLSLVALGRTALDQGDGAAARAAFAQAVAHVHGRSRTLAGGTLLVQALAGSSRASGETAPYEEACRLFGVREAYDFSWYWLCTDDVTCLDLAAAARALGRAEEAAAWGVRSRLAPGRPML